MLSDVRCLNGLTNLRTLVLDRNKIESHVVFPSLPQLETLWINCNAISNLSIFIENVVNAFPCLRYLSMMNNKAAPSYFNGGSVEEFNDYRYTCMCVCACVCVYTCVYAYAYVHMCCMYLCVCACV